MGFQFIVNLIIIYRGSLNVAALEMSSLHIMRQQTVVVHQLHRFKQRDKVRGHSLSDAAADNHRVRLALFAIDNVHFRRLRPHEARNHALDVVLLVQRDVTKSIGHRRVLVALGNLLGGGRTGKETHSKESQKCKRNWSFR